MASTAEPISDWFFKINISRKDFCKQVFRVVLSVKTNFRRSPMCELGVWSGRR